MTADGDPALAAESREALRPRGQKAQLESSQLRPGWTTGACACAAATSAFVALETGGFPDPVGIALPDGHEAAFALTQWRLRPGLAVAAVTKDASDDPDVTHGAAVQVMIGPGEPGGDVRFTGGKGVGTVTLPELPLSVGEPAVNPKPREYITANITAAAERLGAAPDVCVIVSIGDGACIAEKTWNSRIGVPGGLSVLGATGVVVPYSCSAWIAPIHRGIDVTIATGATHATACTGSTLEWAVEGPYSGIELLGMGDFVGTVLRCLRKHPPPRLAIVGGAAKLSKLAAGHLDLHSHHIRIQPDHLRQLVEEAGTSLGLAEAIGEIATVTHAVTLAGEAGINLPQLIADSACDEALAVLSGAPLGVEIMVTDCVGEILAKTRWPTRPQIWGRGTR